MLVSILFLIAVFCKFPSLRWPAYGPTRGNYPPRRHPCCSDKHISQNDDFLTSSILSISLPFDSCGVLQRPNFVTGSGPNPKRNPDFSRIVMVFWAGFILSASPSYLTKPWLFQITAVIQCKLVNDHFTTGPQWSGWIQCLGIPKKMNIRIR